MLEGSLVSGTLRTGYPVHSWEPSCSRPTALPSAAVIRKLMSAHHLLSWPLMIKWACLGCKWQKSGQTGWDMHKRRTYSIPGKSKRESFASCVSRAQKKQCHQYLPFSPSRVLLSSVCLPFAGNKADPWKLLVCLLLRICNPGEKLVIFFCPLTNLRKDSDQLVCVLPTPVASAESHVLTTKVTMWE